MKSRGKSEKEIDKSAEKTIDKTEKTQTERSGKSASSKKKSSGRSTAGGKNKEAIGLQIEGAKYILLYQHSLMVNYAKELAKVYIDPLSEHCLKRRTKKEERTEQNELKDKLKDALKDLTDWDTEESEEHRLHEQSRVTLSELAALSRLRTLHRLLGEFASLTDKLLLWMQTNEDNLKKKSSDGLLLIHCKQSFEAAAAISEVFRLKAINRMDCKKKYQSMMRGTGDDEGKWDLVETIEINAEDPRGYVKPLEGRINHLRNIVHIIGSAMQNQLLCIFNAVPASGIGVKISDVKEILARIPPPFLNPIEMTLSKFVTKLLGNPPKGRYLGQTSTRSTETTSKKSKRDASQTTKRTSKYNNPLKERKTSSRRSGRSTKSSKRSKKSGRSSRKSKKK